MGNLYDVVFCLQVDRPGVVYVKTTSLTRDPAEIAALVSKMSSGRNTPNSPAVSRRLGFHSPPGGPGTPRRSAASPRSSSTPGGYLPWSSSLTHKPCRVFCVATASSRRVKGGWDVEVSELSPFEIDSVAPVRVENRSGASIAFRQGDTPITSAGDDVVEPGAIVAYTWDDPFGAKKLVVSVPGSEYETTVSIHPDSSADREDSDSIDEEDEEGGSHVTRQMVVRSSTRNDRTRCSGYESHGASPRPSRASSPWKRRTRRPTPPRLRRTEVSFFLLSYGQLD